MCLTLCVQVMEYMEVGSLTPTSACRLSEKGNIRSRILDGAVTGGCARVYAGVAHQLPISCPSVAPLHVRASAEVVRELEATCRLGFHSQPGS